jgi:hypothetical protein
MQAEAPVELPSLITFARARSGFDVTGRLTAHASDHIEPIGKRQRNLIV